MAKRPPISIHAPCTGSDGLRPPPGSVGAISIHAPCTGSDGIVMPQGRTRGDFNPRSLHGERRRTATHKRRHERFQSTLPARGATVFPDARTLGRRDFNPRSLHGERPDRRRGAPERPAISIHAPCTGSDVFPDARTLGRRISIHAPCTGSDFFVGMASAGRRGFQSTLPARGATRRGRPAPREHGISIHAPCTGSDHGTPRLTRAGHDFNPRSLHGERPRKVTILSIRIIGFAQKVYHKTVLLRISLAENAVILPEKP